MSKIKASRRLPVERWHSVAKTVASVPSKLRAREPISRSSGMVRGKFPSRKMNRMIHWESQLERDAVYLYEYSPGVVAYREQPLTIFYTLDSKTRRYTPDFELTLSTGEVLFIEIKPSEKLSHPDERRRFDRIREHFAGLDKSFRILTEVEIRRPQLLENLRMLARNRGTPISLIERRMFHQQMAGKRIITFREAVLLLAGATTVWRLISERLLSCDLGQIVNGETLLCVVITENSNDKLFF